MAKEEKKLNNSKKVKKENKHFFKDFKAELKKVIWPTPKQIINNTTTVIGIVLITVAIVFVLDLAFDALNTYGISKRVQISIYVSAISKAKSFDSSTFIPPNNTNGK